MISIRRRLTFLLCLAVGALFVVTGIGVFVAMRGLLQRQFDETLTAKATALITASEIDGGDFEIDLTVQNFAGFGPGGQDYFEIRRRSEKLFLRSPSLTKDGFRISHEGDVAAPGDDRPQIFAARLGDGRRARFYVQNFFPKDDKKKRFQNLYLIVASPTSGMYLQLALLATVLAIAGAAALIAMVPLIRLGLRGGLKPLQRLSADVQAIRPDTLHQRLDTARLPAELEPVAASLNDWLGRLEASFERERRFSSHAAHELRTPLAEIRSMAELGAMWADEATPDRCGEIVKVADEMEGLLDKLSLLARADAGSQPVTLGSVRLDESIAHIIQRYSQIAAQRGIGIDASVDKVEFTTDPVLWSTILQNLIGNAVAHAPPGSRVEIEANRSRFLIRNPAPNLHPEDIEHFFERFWQKDASHGSYNHSGLGLSIVKACTKLLRGTVTARLTSDAHFETEILWEAGHGKPGC